MNNIPFVISDLHFDFKRCDKKYRLSCPSCSLYPRCKQKDHDRWLTDLWNSVITKNDIVYILGDAANSAKGLKNFLNCNGQKILVLGNHDLYYKEYQKYFKEIKGDFFEKYDETCSIWFSHVACSSENLEYYALPKSQTTDKYFGTFNIHGHFHNSHMKDPRYFNVCVDQYSYTPTKLSKVIEQLKIGIDLSKRNK